MNFVSASILCGFAVYACCSAAEWVNCPESESCKYCFIYFELNPPNNETVGDCEDPQLSDYFTFESQRIIVILPSTIPGKLPNQVYLFYCRNNDDCKRKYDANIDCHKALKTPIKDFTPVKYDKDHLCPCNKDSRSRMENGDLTPPCMPAENDTRCEVLPDRGFINPYCYWDTNGTKGCALTNNSAYGESEYADMLTIFDSGEVMLNVNANIIYESGFPATGETLSMQLGCPMAEDYKLSNETYVNISSSTAEMQTTATTAIAKHNLWEIFGPVGAVITIFLTVVNLMFVSVNLRKIYQAEKRWRVYDRKGAVRGDKKSPAVFVPKLGGKTKVEAAHKKVSPATKVLVHSLKGSVSIRLPTEHNGMSASEKSSKTTSRKSTKDPHLETPEKTTKAKNDLSATSISKRAKNPAGKKGVKK